MDILLGDIPSLHTKYSFTLKKHDIDLLNNYRLLEEMEQTYGRTGDDLPVIFVGDSVFYGPEKVYDKMSKVLKIHAGGRQKEPEVPRQDTMAAAIKKVTLYYFFQPGCDE